MTNAISNSKLTCKYYRFGEDKKENGQTDGIYLRN